MLQRVRQLLTPIVRHPNLIKAVADAELRALRSEVRAMTPDNPCLRGFQVYSQSEEDGVIEEIFRRIGGGRTFLEVGCGHGLENNTHYLLLKGWSGTWVDGNRRNIERIQRELPTSERLVVVHRMVTVDNVNDLQRDVDFLSLDIDGNDLYVLKRLLPGPKVICVEYNATFPPPLSIAMKYNPAHRWKQDAYHGASLQAFVDALLEYQLVACNLTGGNAFFVRRDLAGPFTVYPVEQLYRPLRYYLFLTGAERQNSYEFLANVLASQSVDSIGFDGSEVGGSRSS
jgi:hypothetical protein